MRLINHCSFSKADHCAGMSAENEYEKLQQLVDQTLSMSEKEFMDLLPAKMK